MLQLSGIYINFYKRMAYILNIAVFQLTPRQNQTRNIYFTMYKQQITPPKDACPSAKNDQQEAESSFLPFELLTINEPKISQNESQFISCDKACDSQFTQTFKSCNFGNKKGKIIQKRQKEAEDDKKLNMNRKRRIAYLQNRVEQLQKEVSSLRRNEHSCSNCRQRLPDYYREKIGQIIHPEASAPEAAGDYDNRKHLRDSLEFQKIDFHVPLMQTQEIEEKMWIFLGTMLIAMGSKVMDFDGTINTFRVLKEAVDRIRRQVEKGQSAIGIDFFCCKQELHEPGALISGMNYDPFYNSKVDPTINHFSLEGVKIESVEQFELFYDYKYNFNIKYDALLTIMEYARDNCTLS